MVVQEKLAQIIEIRPSRSLFCRHLAIGAQALGSDEKSMDRKTKARVLTLVCVHGSASSQECFLPFLQALDESLATGLSNEVDDESWILDCWMYDLVGCGSSPIPNNGAAYSNAEQVQDLEWLLREQILSQDPDRPIFFVGHSYSPNLIYELLETTKIKFKLGGLVLLSTGLKNPKYQLQDGGPPIFRLPLFVLKCLQPILTNVFLQNGYAPATHKNNPAMIAQAKSANNANDMGAVCHIYKAHVWYDSIDAVRRDHCPDPLLLHGEEDYLIPIECGQDLANRWQVPLVSIGDASHCMLVEQPEKIASHVRQYLSRKMNIL